MSTAPAIPLRANGTTSEKPQIVNGYYGVNLIPANIRKKFVTELNSICLEVGIATNWILLVMYKESTLQATAKNVQTVNGKKKIVAAGLIQFTASTAKGLGTTIQALLQMDALQQLKYVRLYLLQYKGKMKDYPSTYLAVFFPVALPWSMDKPFETKNLTRSQIVAWNPIDYNNSGYITKREFYTYAYKNLSTKALELVGKNAPGDSTGTEQDNAKGAMLPPVIVKGKQTYYFYTALIAGALLWGYNNYQNG